MTVTVTRSGGFLGTTRTAHVSTELLTPDVAQRIERAAAQLPATATPPPPGSADHFHYDVTVTDGAQTRTLRFDGDPNPASALIEDVFANAN